MVCPRTRGDSGWKAQGEWQDVGEATRARQRPRSKSSSKHISPRVVIGMRGLEVAQSRGLSSDTDMAEI